MSRPSLRTCVQLALGAGVVAAVCVLCAVGVVAELGLRAIAWAWGDAFDDAGFAGQDEDALDDGRFE